MSKRFILAGTENKKAVEFLTAYFSETQSIPAAVRSRTDFSDVLTSDLNFVFLDPDWIDERNLIRFKELKLKYPHSKWFALGHPKNQLFQWDAEIELPIDEKQFQKIMFAHIAFPKQVKLMVVDDEPEISEMIQDYFDVRKDPAFQVRSAFNGLEGFKLIQEEEPDCLILDIKMPVKTGVDLYRELVLSGRRIPTIIFIDSTAAEDILEIRKYGSPAFVEKGGNQSSMPEMLSLVKKLIAFS